MKWLVLVLALASCKRIGADTQPAPSASTLAVKNVDGMTVLLTVVVSASGAVTVDGRPVKDDSELTDRARDALPRSPDVRAVIHADKTVVHGRVLAVIEALKRGGVTKIAFPTEVTN